MPFSNQTSSSPITAPHSNLKSLAYLDSTIYYTTGDDQTKIFAMDSIWLNLGKLKIQVHLLQLLIVTLNL